MNSETSDKKNTNIINTDNLDANGIADDIIDGVADSNELVYEDIYEISDRLVGIPGQMLDEDSSDENGEISASRSSRLADSDLSAFFGSDGPLAAALPGYELRPTQLAMAEAVKRAILEREHALIEAPTGTGKSIAYLVPALLSGQTVVVATANKSLQSQLFSKDIPFLGSLMEQEIDAVVIKGRSNYVCTYKWQQEDQAQRQIALYDREQEQVTNLRSWLTETETGDVDDLPFLLSSDLRPRVVSFPDDCLQSDCPYYSDDCWVNFMRDRAANAQILITNHHLLLNAMQLGREGQRILPRASIYIVDEAHQLEQTATSIFETTVTDYTVEQLLNHQVIQDRLSEEELDSFRTLNLLAFQHVAHLSRDNSFQIEGELESMSRLGKMLSDLGKRLKDQNPYQGDAPDVTDATNSAEEDGEGTGVFAEDRRRYELTISNVNSAATKLATVATDRHDANYVRYAVRINDRRRVTLELHAAPIDPAQLLAKYLFDAVEDDEPVQRAVICTSATLATNRNFEHFKHRCGIEETGEEHVLSTVFDFSKQSLLYQPALPAYNYRNPTAFYDAVASEIERLIQVSRGRALGLFTSWSGLQQVGSRLQNPDREIIWPIRAQGDAPRDALLAWFKETPHSVLLATRSFWEGVDIPGDDLSLVVLDKMPFPTPGDPLHSARMKAIDDAGESSFGQYMLPLMTLALKQGFGRLIRRASDNGVVAILDERLSSKGYGRQARNDLPPARFTREFGDVHRFYQDSLHVDAEFAVNVWALPTDGSSFGGEISAGDSDVEVDAGSNSVYWRWQLLRLQDGKADEDEGFADDPASVADVEIYAMTEALTNLRQRIERAGRSPSDFAVEVRCSDAAAARTESRKRVPTLAAWRVERDSWRALRVVALAHHD